MKELLLTFAMLRGADIASTQVVLNQGGIERNPFLPQQPSLNLALGAASTAGEIAAMHALSKKHPTIAKWMVVGGIVLEGWTVQHNVRGIR